MSASRPNRSRSIKRRRASKPLMPWPLIGTLFLLYFLIGVILSVPAPPNWVWFPAVLGMLLLILGLNRPASVSQRFDPVRLVAYVGGLLLVVALAIATNYIGGKSLEGVSFLVAVVGLVGFTLLAIALTGVAAIISAQAGEQIRAVMGYWPTIGTVVSACVFGLSLGAVAGFSTLILTR